MKKYYKVASLALAGVLAASSVVPISALADEEVPGVEEASDTEEEAVEEAPVEEEAFEETTTEVTLVFSGDTVAGEEVEPEEVEEEKDLEDGLLEETEEPALEPAAEVEAVPAEENLTEEIPASEEPAEEKPIEEIPEEEFLTEEELLSDEELELLEADENQDFNEDGINDLYTKMLCEGEILTESGEKAFGELSYLQVQQTNDLDCDGLTNGEEAVVRTREDGSLYVELVSNPCKADTDGDGIGDADDTAPWSRGLEGGVLGNVRLIARHDDNKNIIHGHVYIVYTSYVNGLEISIDNLYGYYVANPEKKAMLDELCDSEYAKEVSWRSTVDEITEANAAEREAAANDLYQPQNIKPGTGGTVVLNRGDYVSLGNYGMSTQKEVIANDYLPFLKDKENLTDEELADLTYVVNSVLNKNYDVKFVWQHRAELFNILAMHGEAFTNHVLYDETPGGVWINRELYNQKLEYDQGPNEVIEQDATGEQLNVMLDYFRSNSYFNTFTHNCTTVAAGAWNEAIGTTTNESGEKVQNDYYVNSGTEIHNQGYNPFTQRLEKTDTVINHPGAVKESIKSLKNLPGYIGSMTYVTGKKVINSVIAAAKKFNIAKLFIKVTKDEAVVVELPEEKEAGHEGIDNTGSEKDVNVKPSNETASNKVASNSEKKASTDPVFSTEGVLILSSVPGTEDLVGEETEEVSGNTSSKRKVTIEEAESEPVITIAEAEDTIQQESSLGNLSREISAGDVPLGLSDCSRSLLWIWAGIVGMIVVGGATTAIVVNRKKNK